ncbi:MAG: hypothetical protein ABJA81_13035, partial [Nocardioidaceae bacterium]
CRDSGARAGFAARGAAASHRLDAIASLCASHVRIGQLNRQAVRAQRFEEELARLRTENARLESWINASTKH